MSSFVVEWLFEYQESRICRYDLETATSFHKRMTMCVELDFFLGYACIENQSTGQDIRLMRLFQRGYLLSYSLPPPPDFSLFWGGGGEEGV